MSIQNSFDINKETTRLRATGQFRLDHGSSGKAIKPKIVEPTKPRKEKPANEALHSEQPYTAPKQSRNSEVSNSFNYLVKSYSESAESDRQIEDLFDIFKDSKNNKDSLRARLKALNTPFLNTVQNLMEEAISGSSGQAMDDLVEDLLNLYIFLHRDEEQEFGELGCSQKQYGEFFDIYEHDPIYASPIKALVFMYAALELLDEPGLLTEQQKKYIQTTKSEDRKYSNFIENSKIE